MADNNEVEKVERDVLKTHGDERDADNEHVQNVKGGAEEGAFVQNQAVRDQLEEQFQREDAREEHVELTQELKPNK